MNTPKIRFKGFTDDWEQRKFGELVNEIREKTKSENEDTLLSCAIDGMYLNSELFSHFRGSSSIGYLKVKKNDLILSAQNLHLGNCNVNLRFEHGIISPAYKVYELVDCNPLFIQAWVKQDSTKDFFLKASTEGASVCRKNIVWEELYEQTVSVPEIKEQEKIGYYFQSLDHLITLHQRKCDETKQLKKFMLQKMFPKNGEKNPEIRFEGFTDDWEQRKLGEVAEYRNGKAHENEIDEDGEYIVVNSKFVSTNAEIRKFSNAQNEPLYENEIAFVLSDVPNGRAIARTFLVDKSGKYTLNQRIAGITPHEDTDPYYLHIRMNRNAYFLKFDDGNKQTNLSIKDVLNYEDMYPSYKEQQKIGSYFGKLDHLITLHQRKCEKLKELKKFMLQKMFV